MGASGIQDGHDIRWEGCNLISVDSLAMRLTVLSVIDDKSDKWQIITHTLRRK